MYLRGHLVSTSLDLLIFLSLQEVATESKGLNWDLGFFVEGSPADCSSGSIVSKNEKKRNYPNATKVYMKELALGDINFLICSWMVNTQLGYVFVKKFTNKA